MRYKFKTRPYLHQKRALMFALRQFKAGRNPAFLMEPRTGKTKTTIDTLGCLHLQYGLRKVLVVAPNRVLGTWVQEIHTHCPFPVEVIVWDRKARRTAIPQPSPMYDLQVVLVNYEAFGVPGRKLASGRRSKASGRFKFRSMIQKWVGQGPAAAVLDESHKIKSSSGKASNMIVSMRNLFRFRFILTGTPVTKAKRIHDLFMQWRWLNEPPEWGRTSEEFRTHTGVWISSNGFPQWIRARPRGVADAQAFIAKDSVIVRREDCFDLPPREDRVVPIQLSPIAAKHYDEMAEDMLTRLENGEIAEASIPLVVALRLQQITSGFVGIQKRVKIRGEPKLVTLAHRISDEKLTVLEDLLREESIERDEKIVIAARFKPDLNAIVKLCQRLKIPAWEIRGGLKRHETDEAIRKFRNHEGVGAMVIQPQAASLGIDLSTAAHMVWYSLTPSWVDFTQACDRIALSRRSTTFTYLLAEGTVDHLVYEALRMDGQIAKAIMRKPERILRT